jgi:hypothetical protein
VYADALVEKGDPRGELIQLACAGSRTSEQNARLAELVTREEASLVQLGVTSAPTWDRGFIVRAAALAHRLVTQLDAAMDAMPLLEALRFVDANGERMRNLMEHPLAAGLVELDIWSKYQGPVGSVGAGAIGTSPHTAALRTLIFGGALGGSRIGPVGVKALIANRGLRLRRLGLSENKIGDKGARLLGEWEGLATIEELELVNCDLGDDAALALFESRHTGALKKLDVSATHPAVKVRMSQLSVNRLERRFPFVVARGQG